MEMVNSGHLSFDEKQLNLLVKLDKISEGISSNSKSWFSSKTTKGLYIRGEVGRGKTQIMDIFFENLDIKKKKRQHFHRFMKGLHEDLEELSGQEDPLQVAAKEISQSTDILCFDEFYVEDIGDAMLLGRFITKLFENEVTLIATSNTHPDNLYENGLHRDRFLPAIKSLKENCEIYELDSLQDYRLRTLEQLEIFIISKDDVNKEKLSKNFSDLTGNDFKENGEVEILGRKIETVKLAQGSVWFNFKELCEGPRSAKDYIEICTEFHTVIVSDIPIFTNDNGDSARRFIALVDECYERKVNLILSLEAALEDLYKGKKLTEPYKRTLSRLLEMRSREYLSKPHLG
jgi:cell division protein ZapE